MSNKGAKIGLVANQTRVSGQHMDRRIGEDPKISARIRLAVAWSAKWHKGYRFREKGSVSQLELGGRQFAYNARELRGMRVAGFQLEECSMLRAIASEKKQDTRYVTTIKVTGKTRPGEKWRRRR